MPDIQRQARSGALIFKPTVQEQAILDTQKALDIKSKALDKKLEEVDNILERLNKLEGR